jgi:hypothetical protein
MQIVGKGIEKLLLNMVLKNLIKDINSKRNGMQIARKVIESLLLNMVLRKKNLRHKFKKSFFMPIYLGMG